MRASVAIAATAAVMLAATACGTGGGGDVSNVSFVTGTSSAAALAPANATAYFAVDTSLSSTQWQQVGTLLSRFPDRAKIVTELLQSWKSSTQTSFQADVKPGLGEQLDGVVFSHEGRRAPDVVVLLQPKDVAAFNRLVARLNRSSSSPAAVSDYRGWKILGQSHESIAAFEAAAKSEPALAGDARFKDAVGHLSKDALATVYANGAKVTAAAIGFLPPAVTAARPRGTFDWAAADLTATGEGLRFDAVTRSAQLTSTTAPSSATLLDKIPADVLGVAWFDGRGSRRQNTQLPKALQQGLGATGTTIPGRLQRLVRRFTKVGAALAHENALYVRRGSGPFPDVTLLTTPDNAAATNTAVTNLARDLSSIHAFPEQITIDKVAAHVVDLGRVSLYYGVDQRRLIVSTSQQAFIDFDRRTPRLSDDSTFKEAASQSDMPSATDGFVYVNLTSSVQTIESFAQAAGSPLPRETQNNLRPLHTAVAWATNDGKIGTFSVFVGIN